MTDHCGYSVTRDGEEEPCGRPIAGWRWYQNVGEHEDLLDTACDRHMNEGGQRIHDAEEKLAKVEALADEFDSEVDWSAGRWDYGDNQAWESAAHRLRAALSPEATT